MATPHEVTNKFGASASQKDRLVNTVSQENASNASVSVYLHDESRIQTLTEHCTERNINSKKEQQKLHPDSHRDQGYHTDHYQDERSRDFTSLNADCDTDLTASDDTGMCLSTSDIDSDAFQSSLEVLNLPETLSSVDNLCHGNFCNDSQDRKYVHNTFERVADLIMKTPSSSVVGFSVNQLSSSVDDQSSSVDDLSRYPLCRSPPRCFHYPDLNFLVNMLAIPPPEQPSRITSEETHSVSIKDLIDAEIFFQSNKHVDSTESESNTLTIHLQSATRGYCETNNETTSLAQQHFCVRLMVDSRPHPSIIAPDLMKISKFISSAERPAIFTKSAALLARQPLIRHNVHTEHITRKAPAITQATLNLTNIQKMYRPTVYNFDSLHKWRYEKLTLSHFKTENTENQNQQNVPIEAIQIQGLSPTVETSLDICVERTKPFYSESEVGSNVAQSLKRNESAHETVVSHTATISTDVFQATDNINKTAKSEFCDRNLDVVMETASNKPSVPAYGDTLNISSHYAVLTETNILCDAVSTTSLSEFSAEVTNGTDNAGAVKSLTDVTAHETPTDVEITVRKERISDGSYYINDTDASLVSPSHHLLDMQDSTETEQENKAKTLNTCILTMSHHNTSHALAESHAMEKSLTVNTGSLQVNSVKETFSSMKSVQISESLDLIANPVTLPIECQTNIIKAEGNYINVVKITKEAETEGKEKEYEESRIEMKTATQETPTTNAKNGEEEREYLLDSSESIEDSEQVNRIFVLSENIDDIEEVHEKLVSPEDEEEKEAEEKAHQEDENHVVYSSEDNEKNEQIQAAFIPAESIEGIKEVHKVLISSDGEEEEQNEVLASTEDREISLKEELKDFTYHSHRECFSELKNSHSHELDSLEQKEVKILVTDRETTIKREIHTSLLSQQEHKSIQSLLNVPGGNLRTPGVDAKESKRNSPVLIDNVEHPATPPNSPMYETPRSSSAVSSDMEASSMNQDLQFTFLGDQLQAGLQRQTDTTELPATDSVLKRGEYTTAPEYEHLAKVPKWLVTCSEELDVNTTRSTEVDFLIRAASPEALDDNLIIPAFHGNENNSSLSYQEDQRQVSEFQQSFLGQNDIDFGDGTLRTSEAGLILWWFEGLVHKDADDQCEKHAVSGSQGATADYNSGKPLADQNGPDISDNLTDELAHIDFEKVVDVPDWRFTCSDTSESTGIHMDGHEVLISPPPESTNLIFKTKAKNLTRNTEEKFDDSVSFQERLNEEIHGQFSIEKTKSAASHFDLSNDIVEESVLKHDQGPKHSNIVKDERNQTSISNDCLGYKHSNISGKVKQSDYAITISSQSIVITESSDDTVNAAESEALTSETVKAEQNKLVHKTESISVCSSTEAEAPEIITTKDDDITPIQRQAVQKTVDVDDTSLQIISIKPELLSSLVDSFKQKGETGNNMSSGFFQTERRDGKQHEQQQQQLEFIANVNNQITSPQCEINEEKEEGKEKKEIDEEKEQQEIIAKETEGFTFSENVSKKEHREYKLEAKDQQLEEEQQQQHNTEDQELEDEQELQNQEFDEEEGQKREHQEFGAEELKLEDQELEESKQKLVVNQDMKEDKQNCEDLEEEQQFEDQELEENEHTLEDQKLDEEQKLEDENLEKEEEEPQLEGQDLEEEEEKEPKLEGQNLEENEQKLEDQVIEESEQNCNVQEPEDNEQKLEKEDFELQEREERNERVDHIKKLEKGQLKHGKNEEEEQTIKETIAFNYFEAAKESTEDVNVEVGNQINHHIDLATARTSSLLSTDRNVKVSDSQKERQNEVFSELPLHEGEKGEIRSAVKGEIRLEVQVTQEQSAILKETHAQSSECPIFIQRQKILMKGSYEHQIESKELETVTSTEKTQTTETLTSKERTPTSDAWTSLGDIYTQSTDALTSPYVIYLNEAHINKEREDGTSLPHKVTSLEDENTQITEAQIPEKETKQITEVQTYKEQTTQITMVQSPQEETKYFTDLQKYQEGTKQVTVTQASQEKTKQMTEVQIPQEETKQMTEVQIPQEETKQITKVQTSEEETIHKNTETRISHEEIKHGNEMHMSPEETLLITDMQTSQEQTKQITVVQSPQEETIQITDMQTSQEQTKQITVVQSPQEETKQITVVQSPHEETIQITDMQTSQEQTKQITVVQSPQKETKQITVVQSPQEETKQITEAQSPQEDTIQITDMQTSQEQTIQITDMQTSQEQTIQITDMQTSQKQTIQITEIHLSQKETKQITEAQSQKEKTKQITEVQIPQEVPEQIIETQTSQDKSKQITDLDTSQEGTKQIAEVQSPKQITERQPSQKHTKNISKGQTAKEHTLTTDMLPSLEDSHVQTTGALTIEETQNTDIIKYLEEKQITEAPTYEEGTSPANVLTSLEDTHSQTSEVPQSFEGTQITETTLTSLATAETIELVTFLDKTQMTELVTSFEDMQAKIIVSLTSREKTQATEAVIVLKETHTSDAMISQKETQNTGALTSTKVTHTQSTVSLTPISDALTTLEDTQTKIMDTPTCLEDTHITESQPSLEETTQITESLISLEETTQTTESLITLEETTQTTESLITLEKTQTTKSLTSLEETKTTESVTSLDETQITESLISLEESQTNESLTPLEESQTNESLTSLEETQITESLTSLEESQTNESLTSLEESQTNESLTSLEETQITESLTSLEESQTNESLTPLEESQTNESLTSLEETQITEPPIINAPSSLEDRYSTETLAYRESSDTFTALEDTRAQTNESLISLDEPLINETQTYLNETETTDMLASLEGIQMQTNEMLRSLDEIPNTEMLTSLNETPTTEVLSYVEETPLTTQQTETLTSREETQINERQTTESHNEASRKMSIVFGPDSKLELHTPALPLQTYELHTEVDNMHYESQEHEAHIYKQEQEAFVEFLEQHQIATGKFDELQQQEELNDEWQKYTDTEVLAKKAEEEDREEQDVEYEKEFGEDHKLKDRLAFEEEERQELEERQQEIEKVGKEKELKGTYIIEEAQKGGEKHELVDNKEVGEENKNAVEEKNQVDKHEIEEKYVLGKEDLNLEKEHKLRKEHKTEEKLETDEEHKLGKDHREHREEYVPDELKKELVGQQEYGEGHAAEEHSQKGEQEKKLAVKKEQQYQDKEEEEECTEVWGENEGQEVDDDQDLRKEYELEEEKQELEIETQEISEKRQEVEIEKQELQEDEQELHTEKQELREQKQEIQIEKQELREEKQELQIEKQELREEKQELQIEKQELQIEKQELREEKQELQIEKQELREEKQELRDEKQELQELQKEKQELKKRELEEDKQKLDEERQLLEIQKQELEEEEKQEIEVEESEFEDMEQELEEKQELEKQEEMKRELGEDKQKLESHEQEKVNISRSAQVTSQERTNLPVTNSITDGYHELLQAFDISEQDQNQGFYWDRNIIPVVSPTSVEEVCPEVVKKIVALEMLDRTDSENVVDTDLSMIPCVHFKVMPEEEFSGINASEMETVNDNGSEINQMQKCPPKVEGFPVVNEIISIGAPDVVTNEAAYKWQEAIFQINEYTLENTVQQDDSSDSLECNAWQANTVTDGDLYLDAELTALTSEAREDTEWPRAKEEVDKQKKLSQEPQVQMGMRQHDEHEEKSLPRTVNEETKQQVSEKGKEVVSAGDKENEDLALVNLEEDEQLHEILDLADDYGQKDELGQDVDENAWKEEIEGEWKEVEKHQQENRLPVTPNKSEEDINKAQKKEADNEEEEEDIEHHLKEQQKVEYKLKYLKQLKPTETYLGKERKSEQNQQLQHTKLTVREQHSLEEKLEEEKENLEGKGSVQWKKEIQFEKEETARRELKEADKDKEQLQLEHEESIETRKEEAKLKEYAITVSRTLVEASTRTNTTVEKDNVHTNIPKHAENSIDCPYRQTTFQTICDPMDVTSRGQPMLSDIRKRDSKVFYTVDNSQFEDVYFDARDQSEENITICQQPYYLVFQNETNDLSDKIQGPGTDDDYMNNDLHGPSSAIKPDLMSEDAVQSLNGTKDKNSETIDHVGHELDETCQTSAYVDRKEFLAYLNAGKSMSRGNQASFSTGIYTYGQLDTTKDNGVARVSRTISPANFESVSEDQGFEESDMLTDRLAHFSMDNIATRVGAVESKATNIPVGSIACLPSDPPRQTCTEFVLTVAEAFSHKALASTDMTEEITCLEKAKTSTDLLQDNVVSEQEVNVHAVSEVSGESGAKGENRQRLDEAAEFSYFSNNTVSLHSRGAEIFTTLAELTTVNKFTETDTATYKTEKAKSTSLTKTDTATNITEVIITTELTKTLPVTKLTEPAASIELKEAAISMNVNEITPSTNVNEVTASTNVNQVTTSTNGSEVTTFTNVTDAACTTTLIEKATTLKETEALTSTTSTVFLDTTNTTQVSGHTSTFTEPGAVLEEPEMNLSQATFSSVNATDDVVYTSKVNSFADLYTESVRSGTSDLTEAKSKMDSRTKTVQSILTLKSEELLSLENAKVYAVLGQHAAESRIGFVEHGVGEKVEEHGAGEKVENGVGEKVENGEGEKVDLRENAVEYTAIFGLHAAEHNVDLGEYTCEITVDVEGNAADVTQDLGEPTSEAKIYVGERPTEAKVYLGEHTTEAKVYLGEHTAEAKVYLGEHTTEAKLGSGNYEYLEKYPEVHTTNKDITSQDTETVVDSGAVDNARLWRVEDTAIPSETALETPHAKTDHNITDEVSTGATREIHSFSWTEEHDSIPITRIDEHSETAEDDYTAQLAEVHSVMTSFSRRVSCDIDLSQSDMIETIDSLVEKMAQELQEGRLSSTEVIQEISNLTSNCANPAVLESSPSPHQEYTKELLAGALTQFTVQATSVEKTGSGNMKRDQLEKEISNVLDEIMSVLGAVSRQRTLSVSESYSEDQLHDPVDTSSKVQNVRTVKVSEDMIETASLKEKTDEKSESFDNTLKEEETSIVFTSARTEEYDNVMPSVPCNSPEEHSSACLHPGVADDRIGFLSQAGYVLREEANDEYAANNLLTDVNKSHESVLKVNKELLTRASDIDLYFQNGCDISMLYASSAAVEPGQDTTYISSLAGEDDKCLPFLKDGTAEVESALHQSGMESASLEIPLFPSTESAIREADTKESVLLKLQSQHDIDQNGQRLLLKSEKRIDVPMENVSEKHQLENVQTIDLQQIQEESENNDSRNEMVGSGLPEVSYQMMGADTAVSQIKTHSYLDETLGDGHVQDVVTDVLTSQETKSQLTEIGDLLRISVEETNRTNVVFSDQSQVSSVLNDAHYVRNNELSSTVCSQNERLFSTSTVVKENTHSRVHIDDISPVMLHDDIPLIKYSDEQMSSLIASKEYEPGKEDISLVNYEDNVAQFTHFTPKSRTDRSTDIDTKQLSLNQNENAFLAVSKSSSAISPICYTDTKSVSSLVYNNNMVSQEPVVQAVLVSDDSSNLLDTRGSSNTVVEIDVTAHDINHDAFSHHKTTKQEEEIDGFMSQINDVSDVLELTSNEVTEANVLSTSLDADISLATETTRTQLNQTEVTSLEYSQTQDTVSSDDSELSSKLHSVIIKSETCSSHEKTFLLRESIKTSPQTVEMNRICYENTSEKPVSLKNKMISHSNEGEDMSSSAVASSITKDENTFCRSSQFEITKHETIFSEDYSQQEAISLVVRSKERLPPLAQSDNKTLTSVDQLESETLPSEDQSEYQILPSVDQLEHETFPSVGQSDQEPLPSVYHSKHEILSSVNHSKDETLPSVDQSEYETLSSVDRSEHFVTSQSLLERVTLTKMNTADFLHLQKLKRTSAINEHKPLSDCSHSLTSVVESSQSQKLVSSSVTENVHKSIAPSEEHSNVQEQHADLTESFFTQHKDGKEHGREDETGESDESWESDGSDDSDSYFESPNYFERLRDEVASAMSSEIVLMAEVEVALEDLTNAKDSPVSPGDSSFDLFAAYESAASKSVPVASKQESCEDSWKHYSDGTKIIRIASKDATSCENAGKIQESLFTESQVLVKSSKEYSETKTTSFYKTAPSVTLQCATSRATEPTSVLNEHLNLNSEISSRLEKLPEDQNRQFIDDFSEDEQSQTEDESESNTEDETDEENHSEMNELKHFTELWQIIGQSTVLASDAVIVSRKDIRNKQKLRFSRSKRRRLQRLRRKHALAASRSEQELKVDAALKSAELCSVTIQQNINEAAKTRHDDDFLQTRNEDTNKMLDEHQSSVCGRSLQVTSTTDYTIEKEQNYDKQGVSVGENLSESAACSGKEKVQKKSKRKKAQGAERNQSTNSDDIHTNIPRVHIEAHQDKYSSPKSKLGGKVDHRANDGERGISSAQFVTQESRGRKHERVANSQTTLEVPHFTLGLQETNTDQYGDGRHGGDQAGKDERQTHSTKRPGSNKVSSRSKSPAPPNLRRLTGQPQRRRPRKNIVVANPHTA